MPAKIQDDDWLEGDPEEKTGRGEAVTISAISNFTGLARMTIDRQIREGCPIISKGTRKQGYRINSAVFFNYFWKAKVAERVKTDNPDAQGFDAAKTREKEAQAKLKEMEIEKRAGRTVTVEEVIAQLSAKLGVVRTRLLAVATDATDDPDTQDRIRASINDALSELSESDANSE